MSEKKGLLGLGHVGNLERAGITLRENSEKGLIEVLKEHSDEVFRVLEDEIRNAMPAGKLENAEYFKNTEGPSSEKTKQTVAAAIHSLDQVRQGIAVSKKLLGLSKKPSSHRDSLQETIKTFQNNLPQWQTRLDALIK